MADRKNALILAAGPSAWNEAMHRVDCLTPRELEVLELVSLGYSSKEIAGRWGISLITVDIHRRNVLMKLQANNMCDAVRIAVHASLAQMARSSQMAAFE